MKIKNIFRNILLTGMSALMATPYNVMAAGLFEEDFSVEDVLLNDNHTEELLQDDINNKEFIAENDNMVVKAIVSELEEMPDGTELIISEVEQDTIEYQSILENIKNEISKQDNSKIISNLIPIHVKFVHEGKEIENIMDDVELDIRLKAENSIINKDTVISSISKDNLVSNLENMSIEEDALRFYTKEFSTLAIFNLTESQNNDALDDLLIEDNINNTQDTEQEEKQQNDTSLDDILIENDSTQEEVTEEDSATEDILLGEEPNTESQDNNSIENEDLLFDKNQINEEENMNLSSDDALLDENHENEYVYEDEDLKIKAIICSDSNIEQDAILTVRDIKKDSAEYSIYQDEIYSKYNKSILYNPIDIKLVNQYTYDRIDFLCNNIKIEISIKSQDFNIKNLDSIACISEFGNIELIESLNIHEPNTFSFTLNNLDTLIPLEINNETIGINNDDKLLIESSLYQETQAYAILYDTGEMVFQRGDTPDPNKGNVKKTYLYKESLESYVPWEQDKLQITEVTFKDVIHPQICYRWFSDCSNLERVNNGSNLDMSRCIDAYYMFQNCVKLQQLDTSTWDTSNLYNLSFMFDGCKLLPELDVSNWNTSQVTAFSSVFRGCESLKILDLSKWDTSKSTLFFNMFYSCKNLKTIHVS